MKWGIRNWGRPSDYLPSLSGTGEVFSGSPGYRFSENRAPESSILRDLASLSSARGVPEIEQVRLVSARTNWASRSKTRKFVVSVGSCRFIREPPGSLFYRSCINQMGDYTKTRHEKQEAVRDQCEYARIAIVRGAMPLGYLAGSSLR